MKKLFLGLALLTACSGTFSGGETHFAAPVGNADDSGQEIAEVSDTNLAGSEGTLGSQSPSSDITPHFYREYALDFEDEPEPSVALIERAMLSSSQAFSSAQVRKVSTAKALELAEVEAPQFTTRWVRAVRCGNFPDEKIEAMIPPQQLDKPWAQDKLLWMVFNLPRPGKAHLIECQSPTYRDFQISGLGKVDLSGLKAVSQDVLFFVSVTLADSPTLGALSTDGEAALSADQWLAVSQKSKLRIVRLLPSGTIYRVHPIPSSVQAFPQQ